MSIFNYQEKKPGYFGRLKDALKTTRDDLSYKMQTLVGKPESPITEAQLDELEQLMITADIGVQTTMEIVDAIREQSRGTRVITSHQVRRMIRRRILEILQGTGTDQASEAVRSELEVVLVVGVNGVGKTTTIGKLAHFFRKQGSEVLLCASDTFRAAAIEQLEIWAGRCGCEIIKQKPGSDPAAVLFDAIAAARSRFKELLIVDTAGRLHSKSNLMQELEKMKRVAGREVEGAPHQVFLILDATTGQNGLVQAREFLKTSGVTGLIVTKLDGTARGGIIVAIAKELQIPIRFIGVGERLEDLLPFDPEAFINTILPEEEALTRQ